jgi:hypothetical protein
MSENSGMPTTPQAQPATAFQQPAAPGGQCVPHPASTAPVQYVQHIYPAKEKETAIAYVLWFFLGALGVHHFYLGKIGRGIGYLLTVGWLTIGLWIDLFTLPSQVRQVNTQARVGLR